MWKPTEHDWRPMNSSCAVYSFNVSKFLLIAAKGFLRLADVKRWIVCLKRRGKTIFLLKGGGKKRKTFCDLFKLKYFLVKGKENFLERFIYFSRNVNNPIFPHAPPLNPLSLVFSLTFQNLQTLKTSSVAFSCNK